MARIFRRDLATGRRELWKEVRPPDQTGLVYVILVVSADGRAYAYSLARCLSSLYLVEGLESADDTGDQQAPWGRSGR